MASSSMAVCFISVLLLLLPLSSTADKATSSICESTPDPTYCKSVLPTTNTTADIYYHGKYSLRKSLSQARNFVALVNESLAGRATMSETAVRALEDCRFLAATNLNFISTSFSVVNGSSKLLPEKNAGDVQTLLSAALTNLDTCSDGLSAAAAAGNGLSPHLKNDSKLHSLSLALFTKGWVPEKKDHVGGWNPRRFTFSRGGVSVNMSHKARQVYEKKGAVRTLLEESVDPVMVSDIVVVSQDGTGNFTSINDAVSAAPNNVDGACDGYFMIYVTAGIYNEYVSIPSYKNYLMMIGDGINHTIITGNRSVGDNFTTFGSATFVVVAPNFVAYNLTFQNTAGAVKGQAVAVRNGADLSTFYSCSFEGYQDTLYQHSMRQFYRECDIYGTVDFIFGNALVVLQTCNIYPRLPLRGQYNTITAQGKTDPNQNTGTSIHNCTMASPDLASSNTTVKTYLGRPWKQYSTTVYMQTFMDNLIDPAGWREWNVTFASTLYYAEYNNTGPKSNTSARVTWPGYHVINDADARNFTVSNYLLGDTWLPLTGTPYMGGLI